MATTYSTTKIEKSAPARAGLGEAIMVTGEFTFTAAPAINDIVRMFVLPKGAVIGEMVLTSDDLDTGGTPTIMLQVGDSTTADRFFAASNIAQAGGMARMDKRGDIGKPLTANTEVRVKVSTGPATGATGTIRLVAIYSMEQ